MTEDADEFLQEVERAFSRELRAGVLKVVEHQYSSEAFGNALIVLEGIGLRLKLKRERSEPYALVAWAREPEEWERLQAVVSAITGGAVAGSVEPVGWELSPNEAAVLFREHQEALAEAYEGWWSWRSTRKKLGRLRKVQRERLDAWLVSPKSDAEKIADDAAERALENRSDELKAALKSLGLDK
jgi:hypothetical protein